MFMTEKGGSNRFSGRPPGRKRDPSSEGSGPGQGRIATGRRRRSGSQGPEARVRGVRMIGAFIPSLTGPAFRRRPPLLVRLVMDWESLVGPELGTRSIPRKLSGGVLTVSCCGPMAMELQYAAPQIVERLNGSCGLWGEERLIRLRIMQDFTQLPSSPAPRARQAVPLSLPELEQGDLRAVLERLGGHVLQRRQRRGQR
ncbi:DUF721 domain-containing protein [Oecophyllibacter saccharovorans]|nr:DUF721 domain-containing protein [Oecophyllibacter saccharovorans]